MTIYLWLGFLLLIFAFLALDLGVFNRKAHVISIREALLWTAFWVAISLLFNVAIFFMYKHHLLGIGEVVGHPLSGGDAALQFFTGYVLEKSLSLDNIFVIAMIFAYFQVPASQQHRVLFWGILGALVLRGAMIALGAALIHRFEWVTYIFGGLLIVTALKMMFTDDEQIDLEHNFAVRLARRFYPVSSKFEGAHFFTRLNGRRAMTPLLLALIVVESSDVLFAIDSIPAIFAVTRDPFLVFTSNVFAILGLRSLYFALAGVIEKFRYLKASLMFVLLFVGVKMILEPFVNLSALFSLGVIVSILATGATASIIADRRDGE
ncbi:MAG: TerC/Alx family metal homeostasis membrane protein [bacterium]|nr:TerC/Alx family metal homeostasis membrane protein [bacterium]